MFRMPAGFGPAPGPRNLPAAERHRRYEKTTTTLSLSAETDSQMLSKLLPPGFALDGPARIEVSLLVLTDIGWLAGRGYNIVMVRIPARWRGKEDIVGHFVPVVWESMTDPILTGREELGWPKIFADIPTPRETDGEWRASASWDGFTFLELTAGDLAPSDAAPGAGPMMFHKYVPRTGEWGQAEVDYCTVSAPDGPTPVIEANEQGRGRFEFHPASWEELPTQYRIVNALATLPLTGFGPATMVRSTGGGDGSGHRRLQ